ncbi:hypothetical protein SeLEV6574_g08029 [Synchytrium endobioticum]|nr:hypothetical protein SeLEV6574_g08029 [Synchytrium endobioticum]
MNTLMRRRFDLKFSSSHSVPASHLAGGGPGLTDKKLFIMAPSGLGHLAQPIAVVERNCVTFAVDKGTQSDREIEQNKATLETVDMALASNKASGAIKPRRSSTTDHLSSSNTAHQQLSQPTKNVTITGLMIITKGNMTGARVRNKLPLH